MTALGLQKDPFSTEPDSQFYYSFDTFEQRLKVLQGLVQGADLFVLVIGEPGSGKTTLLNRYLESADTPWQFARIHMDPETDSTLSSEPGEPRAYPAYISQGSTNPIVIVDDAHQLPRQELDFLIHQALVPGSSEKIKRLVLFGESDLYNTVIELADALSAQPAFSKIYLPGLTEAQTAEYLQHRMAISGYAGEIPFDQGTIQSIHRASGGYPGPINKIAHQWLNDKYSDETEMQDLRQIFSGISRRMFGWLAAGIVILLLTAFWLLSDRRPSAPESSHQKLTKTVLRKKIEQPRISAEPPAGQKAAPVKTSPKPAAAVKPPPTGETKLTAEPPAPVITAPPEQEKPPASVITPRAAQEEPAVPVLTAPPEPEEPAASESTTAAVQKTARQPQIEPPPAAKPPPKTDSQPIAALQPASKPAPTTPGPVKPKTAAGQIHREQWLLSQDPESYTIQIIGVSSETSILDFINENNLLKQNEIAYYESTFNGKPWYQALFGLYPTKQAARRAADKLPENIRRAGPWIRRLSEVQQAIVR